MPQSSITAWLKKPPSFTKADAPKHVPGDAHRANSKVGSSLPTSTALSALPLDFQSPISGDPVLEAAPSTQAGRRTTIPVSIAKSNMFALRSLPANVELVPLTEDLVPGFKRLNSVLLPVPYPDSFYKETMTEPHHSVTLIALWNPAPSKAAALESHGKPHVVGAIRCRLLPTSDGPPPATPSSGPMTLYISTLGLLSPYRKHGIASHLLNRMAVKAFSDYGVKNVTAHVWEANEDGLEWYKNRGFEVVGKEEGYYTKLRPRGAWLVRKRIGVEDLVSAG